MAKKTKKDPQRKAKSDKLKKEMGKRFREFRKILYMAQHQLASELGVFQSTITNVELGKTFPNCAYMYHFYEKYGLNIHWLFTGEGQKFVLPRSKVLELLPGWGATVISGNSDYTDYLDLLKYMKIPEVERIILDKLTELKAAFKDKVEEFHHSVKEQT